MPELGLCGYPPMDLLEREAFLQEIDAAVEQIAGETQKTALIFGAPTRNPKSTGRKIFNSAILAEEGKIVAKRHKTLLPTYDVFDEFRYFEKNMTIEPVEWRGITLGITVCEDIWYNENAIQYHVYEENPTEELCKQGADAIINISASPFTKRKPDDRLRMLSLHAGKYRIPIFYANQVGGNTELIFDGDSMILDQKGELLGRTPLFEEAHIDVEWNPQVSTFSRLDGRFTTDQLSNLPETENRIYHALKLGLKDYLEKTGISDKVVLGLSGGIDSAMAAAIASDTLGPENVIAVTMPSDFSSSGSVTDSEKLAQNFGFTLHEIPIKQLYNDYISALAPLFSGTEFNVAEENLQSRARGIILMAISNKFGYMLLNTGNKSEMAVGYATLYGDMAGGLSALSDVYKTEVFRMARWLNESYYKREMIPQTILEKPPSAELRPDQKDTDSLPEYDIMDGILEAYIEQQKPKYNIVEMGYDPEIVDKVTRLGDMNEFKRRQSPPGLKVSEKAFGIGRRLPIVQKWTGHEKEYLDETAQ